MQSTSRNFRENAARALEDANLQRALLQLKSGFASKRTAARAALPEFDALRAASVEIKNHVLENLDLYLEEYERKVIESGGHVHWARDAAEAREIVLSLCRDAGAKSVTKAMSMVAAEIGLKEALAAAGIEAVETGIGDYIIQARKERPSHIVAPAAHLNPDEFAQLSGEARAVLRPKFFSADVGITGANFLIAETGSSVIVTNEGNGELTQLFPRIHIVVASIEKLVPTLEDASTILRVLARSATGQEMTAYTTFSTGPRRDGDPDGPEAYHVVLLDNGRSEMLGSEFHDMLRCIRCGACMNHCPVYSAIGGHAYGSVYPGPMGAVLTPQLAGIDEAAHLPNASTFCGRCQAVCPMNIPLPKMMRQWREREFLQSPQGSRPKLLLRCWSFLAQNPPLYRAAAGVAAHILSLLAGKRGRFSALPFAGGWTKYRDFPAPAPRTFQSLWRERQRRKERDG